MNINDLLEIRTQIVTRSKMQFVHNFVQIHNNIILSGYNWIKTTTEKGNI